MKEPPTNSAPPTQPTPQDYDSSATASADEGQGGAGRDSPPEVQHIPHSREHSAPPRPMQQPLVTQAQQQQLHATAAAAVAAGAGGSSLKNIIDKTVEDSMAKMRPDQKVFEKSVKNHMIRCITIF